MARIVKEHHERKAEILDTAQMLFREKGYDGTSVNAIIEAVGISKGTFYYYFKSKEELLDSLVERMTNEIMKKLQCTVDDSNLNSLQKMDRIFTASREVKAENKKLIIAYVRVMYRDENLIWRYKLKEKTNRIFGSLFEKVIRQGIDEGVFNTQYPEQMGAMIMAVGSWFQHDQANLILELDKKPENVNILVKNIEVYEYTVEKLLGAPRGSIKVADKGFVKKILNS